MCPILYGLTVQLCPATPACPLRRIGLIDTTSDAPLRVACTFAGYHAVKRACPTLHISDATLTLVQRFESHKNVADYFWTEALDNGLNCRHFRPDFDSSSALVWEERVDFLPRVPTLGTPRHRRSVSVPTWDTSSSAVGTAAPEIRFVAGEDFQWIHEGLATGT